MLLSFHQCQDFDHQLFVLPHHYCLPVNERIAQYYTLKQLYDKDYVPAEIAKEVFKWLQFLGQNTALGNFINKWLRSVWINKVQNKIKSFSSFNLIVEGSSLPKFNIDKSSLYLHTHPSIKNKAYNNVLTFVVPLHIDKMVEQYFTSTDLVKAGIAYDKQIMLSSLNKLDFQILKEAGDSYMIHNKEKFQHLTWTKIMFPSEDETLELRFDAARHLHTVENYTDNSIFLIAIFNDAEYIDPIDPSIIEHEIYKLT